jgi:hypothetical protein
MENQLKPSPRASFAAFVVGLIGGAVTALIAFLLAGAGHGTYLAVAITSAPWGLLFNPVDALLAAPFIWGIVATGALHARYSPIAKTATAGFLIIHYLSAFLVVATTDGGSYPHRVMSDGPGVVLTWGLVYIPLNAVCLFHLFARKPRPTPPLSPLQFIKRDNAE